MTDYITVSNLVAGFSSAEILSGEVGLPLAVVLEAGLEEEGFVDTDFYYLVQGFHRAVTFGKREEAKKLAMAIAHEIPLQRVRIEKILSRVVMEKRRALRFSDKEELLNYAGAHLRRNPSRQTLQLRAGVDSFRSKPKTGREKNRPAIKLSSPPASRSSDPSSMVWASARDGIEWVRKTREALARARERKLIQAFSIEMQQVSKDNVELLAREAASDNEEAFEALKALAWECHRVATVALGELACGGKLEAAEYLWQLMLTDWGIWAHEALYHAMESNPKIQRHIEKVMLEGATVSFDIGKLVYVAERKIVTKVGGETVDIGDAGKDVIAFITVLTCGVEGDSEMLILAEASVNKIVQEARRNNKILAVLQGYSLEKLSALSRSNPVAVSILVKLRGIGNKGAEEVKGN